MYLAYKAIKKNRAKRRAEEAGALEEEDRPVSETPFAAGDPANPAARDEITNASRPEKGTAKKEKKKPELTPEQVAEKHRRRVYRWKVILGLTLPFALQALDTTIIAAALPYIAQDFHQVKQLNWIISSFNLTSAAFLLFWAQLADIFGRHLALQSSIVIMLIGSAICTGAPTSSFPVLLLGRAIQGVGAAGVNMSIRTILADRVSLSEYAVNWTIFALVSGFSFSLGPLLGGYLTSVSWRWCFAINLPIAVVAIVVIFFVLRKDLLGPQPLPELEGHDTTRQARLLARLSTIDYGGQLLFLWGLGLLSLAFTWAGGTYAWTSPAVLAPLVVGAVLSVAWIVYERLMAPKSLIARIFPHQRSMMPWHLLSQRDIGLLFINNFTTGMAMFAVMYFMDIYFAVVKGQSSSKAGLSLLYFLPGLASGAYMAMFSSNVWPRQTLPPLVLGSITSAVGITVIAWAVHADKSTVIYGMMALVGNGVSLRMNPASIHALAYFPTLTAPITCLAAFAMPFGGLIGLTTMTTVFTNKAGANQENGKSAIMWAFIAMIPFMWITVILSTFLGNVWIQKKSEGKGHEVVYGAYLWSLVTRKKLPRVQKTRSDDSGNLVPLAEEERRPGDLESGVELSATRSAGDGVAAPEAVKAAA